MNNIYKTALLLGAAMTIMISAGCGGWLDVPVEATEPADAVDYTDHAGADNLLAGCYSIVSSSRSVGSWAVLAVTAVRGDDTEKGNPSPTDQADLAQFHEFNYSTASSFWALGNAWNDQYWAIVKMNEAIAGFGKYKETGADAVRMDGVYSSGSCAQGIYVFPYRPSFRCGSGIYQLRRTACRPAQKHFRECHEVYH